MPSRRLSGVAFCLGPTAVRLGQNDVDVLSRRAHGDPAEALGPDIIAYPEAESVPVEAKRGVRIVNSNEHCGDGE